MTDVRVGSKVKASWWTQTMTDVDQTAINNITSTTFITGSPTVELTFVAPESGKVLITISSGARDNGGTNRIVCAPELYLGTDASGTAVFTTATSTIDKELTSAGQVANFQYVSRTMLQTGLTAGATYYARLLYKVNAGTTADLNMRELIVRPTT